MNNIKISTKLLFLVIFASTIIVLIGVYSVNNLTKVNTGVETIYRDRVVPLEQLKVISDAYAVDVVDVAHKVRNGNMERSLALRKIAKAEETIDQNWDAYLATQIDGEEERLVHEASKLKEEATIAMHTLYDILNAPNDTASVRRLDDFVVNKMYPSIDPLTEKIADLIALQLSISRDISVTAQELFSTTKSYSYILIAVGVLFAALLSFYIITGINKALRSANRALVKLAAGDLLVEIEVDSRDEIGNMMLNLKKMVDQLKSIISYVREASENKAAASQEMSNGATEQASSTEEVSSSMEEMTANIQQNTDNAQQTEKIALKATEDISESNSMVGKTADAMKIIAEKITIISDIASQTNILALNAAVEAARAGENGRGFAVVAAEIRKLAERSSNAATEINEVSRQSVNLATASGKLLNDIVPNIQRTSRLVQEIAAASIEQNSGTAQINNALQQLNQVTQQNAAASEELAGQAEQLMQRVEFFNVDSRMRRKHTTSIKHSTKQKQSSAGSGVNLHMNDDIADSDFETF